MTEVIKTPGTHIPYETTSKSIVFGEDEDLSINLKTREQDEDCMIDICADINGDLTMGAAAGYRYVAQILIPARKYVEKPGDPDPEGNPTTVRDPVPFDIDLCTIYLYGLED